MKVEHIINSFVNKVNSSPQGPLHQIPCPADEVPEHLRTTPYYTLPEHPEVDVDTGNLWFNWKIIAKDCSKEIQSLQERVHLTFPPSFFYLFSRYQFPAFDIGTNLFIFGNTGKQLFYDLEVRLFKDPYMSPFLLENGFIQIGNPWERTYDPICFNTKECDHAGQEPSIVRLDHEEILMNSKIVILKTVAPSFLGLLQQELDKSP
jgi:hypothetical protein